MSRHGGKSVTQVSGSPWSGGGSESHFFVNFRSLGFPRVGPLGKIFLGRTICSRPGFDPWTFVFITSRSKLCATETLVTSIYELHYVLHESAEYISIKV